ncbi:MAG: glycerol-3-phosphate 1-O-acyltransferase PlsY [Oscillospiraceae bacterium]|nr:glycerol-3-phosphate 1-O-acyltransferase PlsY [Oscillospiraceae bacterium]
MQGTLLGYLASVTIAALCGYLIGSFNGAIVTVRLLKHKDVRKYGSGNAGLTNVLRCFGKGCGLLTLIIDLGKGAAAMALAEWYGKRLGWAPLAEGTGAANNFRWLCYVAAIFVVAGHVFPVWHGFRGGKGVLVGVSVFLVINPWTFVILMAIFAVITLVSKYVSLASIIATLCVIPTTFFLERFQRGTTAFIAFFYTVMIALPAFLIVYSHHENIARLRNGTERKIGEKKKKKRIRRKKPAQSE